MADRMGRPPRLSHADEWELYCYRKSGGRDQDLRGHVARVGADRESHHRKVSGAR